MAYYLLKSEKEKAFYLGDLYWVGIFGGHRAYSTFLKDKRLLYKKIIEEIAVDFDRDVTLSYFMDMAELIVDWVDGDDVHLVGERYLEDFTEDDINTKMKKLLGGRE